MVIPPMPGTRILPTVLAIIFFIAAICGLAWHGYSSRVFVDPPQRESVQNTHAIVEKWAHRGIKGRIAVIMTRTFSGDPTLETTLDNMYLGQALQLGILRKAYMVVPDSQFPKFYSSVSLMKTPSPLKATTDGFALFFESGRIDVIPISKFIPPKESVVIVLDAGLSHDTLAPLLLLLDTGQLSSDLIVTLDASDLVTRAAALPNP